MIPAQVQDEALTCNAVYLIPMKNEIPVYDIGNLTEFKQEDILVSRFAPYLEHHKNLHLAHKHSFYHLLLFTEGSGSHAIDFQRFEVKPYQVYFMIPGQVHSWAFEGHTDGYVVNFSPAFFRSFLLRPDYLEQFPFFSGSPSESVIDLPAALQPMIKHLFGRLIEESETRERMAADMVRNLLLQLFITIGRLQTEQQPASGSVHNTHLVRSFKKLVDQHYVSLRLPRDYAALLHISPNHLNAVSNEVLGIPAGAVIRDRIMLEAKRLLVNLRLSIAEIAYKLDFADNSYFTRFFKKQAGLTPEAFRKQALQQTAETPLR